MVTFLYLLQPDRFGHKARQAFLRMFGQFGLNITNQSITHFPGIQYGRKPLDIAVFIHVLNTELYRRFRQANLGTYFPARHAAILLQDIQDPHIKFVQFLFHAKSFLYSFAPAIIFSARNAMSTDPINIGERWCSSVTSRSRIRTEPFVALPPACSITKASGLHS